MQRFAIIGFPIGHSVSPAMHNAAFRALGRDARYEARPTPAAQLAAVVNELRSSALAGANVTIPHKEAVIPFLDGLIGGARTIGAVNCIVREGQDLVGHNTDKDGFLQSLKAAGIDPRGEAVLVLGAGGSARAVVLALMEAGAARLTVAGRSLERAQRLLADMQTTASEAVPMTTIPWQEETLAREAARARLLVNCTPVGMTGSAEAAASPLPPAGLHAGLCVADLVYNPAVTPLLEQAAAAGAQTLGGLDMLVLQAAESFRLWTGLEPPLADMKAAAQEALARVN